MQVDLEECDFCKTSSAILCFGCGKPVCHAHLLRWCEEGAHLRDAERDESQSNCQVRGSLCLPCLDCSAPLCPQHRSTQCIAGVHYELSASATAKYLLSRDQGEASELAERLNRFRHDDEKMSLVDESESAEASRRNDRRKQQNPNENDENRPRKQKDLTAVKKRNQRNKKSEKCNRKSKSRRKRKINRSRKKRKTTVE
jgi:hypothetical protein